MSTKAKAIPTKVEVEVPEGVNIQVDGTKVVVTGPLGKLEKDFAKVPVSFSIEDNKVHITLRGYIRGKTRKKEILFTARSLIRNMIVGVTKGYTYKMKIVYAHFPINVTVEGDTVVISNFLGERGKRYAKIVGDTKVEVKGDDVIVKGLDKYAVGQTAANITAACKIKSKDPRVFLDGIYVYSKGYMIEE